MSADTGLPRATFAKLSPHPYLLANLDPSDDSTSPARSNGRAQNEARAPTVNLSSLSHAHGSAVVRTGDTTVICGVRAESLLSSNIPNFRESNRETELRDYDLLVPNRIWGKVTRNLEYGTFELMSDIHPIASFLESAF